jgi:glyoxylase-like metal-dependent hydrolase (beta-lactamase superfamily II)
MKTNVFLMSFMSVFAVMSADAAEEFSVVAVTEAKRAMPAAIFPDAAKQDLQKYMPGGTAPASMSSMLLKTGDETVLIDAGLGGADWVSTLEKNGVEAKKVKVILLTHFHGDHVGGLLDGNQRRFPNAKILSAKKEYEYWLPKNAPARNAQLETIRKAYGKDFSETFDFEDTVWTLGDVKVKAIDATGHTPGHTAFLISSPKKKLLIIGDLLHGAALQFPKPEICATYDVTPSDAVKSRKRVLDFSAENNVPIAGMHLPVPCIGTVKKDGKGGYEFRPVSE